MQKYMIEARQLLALAIPVIVAQVAQTAMGFVDTVMAGGYSATDMAAVAIGTSIWLPAILFGHGLLLALTPVIAQLNGSGRRDRVAHRARRVLAGRFRLGADHGGALERGAYHSRDAEY